MTQVLGFDSRLYRLDSTSAGGEFGFHSPVGSKMKV